MDANLLGGRCDAMDALDAIIAHMQQQNPTLTIDDCIDAVFAVGVLAVSATINLTQP